MTFQHASQIQPRLWIGGRDACEEAADLAHDGVRVLHASKTCHRNLLGYTSYGAPKHSPDYLFAERPGHLYLNLIDANRADFLPPTELMDHAVFWLGANVTDSEALPPVLVHCDKGESRAPAIVLLFLAQTRFFGDLDQHGRRWSYPAIASLFQQYYPAFRPSPSIRAYLEQNLGRYLP